MNANLLIIGAGQHGQVIKEISLRMGVFEVIDFLDDNKDIKFTIGTCDEYINFSNKYQYAIPSFGNNKLRMDWLNKLEKAGYISAKIIDPTAYISKKANIYSGTVIEPHVVINTNTTIDKGCILSINSIVDHDSFVGFGCHIDCGAIIKSNSIVKALTKVESGTVFNESLYNPAKK